MTQMIEGQIFDDLPMIKFYKRCDPSVQINATSVSVDTSGAIVFVTTEEGETLSADDLMTYQEFLFVPGVGFLKPETEVFLEGDPTKYSLLFGWHKNTSNQNLMSWYLRPIEEFEENNDSEFMSRPMKKLSGDRTLDAMMVDRICEVTV